MWKQDQETKQN